MYDITHDYNVPFYITGIIAAIGTVCSVLCLVVFYCCQNKENAGTKEENSFSASGDTILDQSKLPADV